MAKVLVERPRGGAGYAGEGYRKEWQRTPPEDWRGRERIKDRWQGGSKYFSDLLGPLHRYLLSNVGRPWDLVYSEICAEIRGKFPVREHFLLHVFQFVDRSVILIDGVPCHGEGRSYGTPLRGSRWRSLYVCPSSGLLKRLPVRRGKRGS